jgi:hypothetical protein
MNMVLRTHIEDRTHVHVALFLTLTTATSSLRAWLRDPEDFAFFDLPRIASLVLGSLCFALLARALKNDAGKGLGLQVARAIWWAFCAAIAVIAVRTFIETELQSMDVAVALPEAGRWLVVWLGYYLAGCGALLTIKYHAALTYKLQESSRNQLEAIAIEYPTEQSRAEDWWVECNRQRVRILEHRIEWIEAEGDYVRIHAEGTAGLVRMTLARAMDRLNPTEFVRVHRSVICRRSAIVGIARLDSGAMKAKLQSGAEVRVGRSYRRSIHNLLNL